MSIRWSSVKTCRARAASVIAAALWISAAGAQGTAADCYCRSPDGEKRDLGTVECVQITGRSWLLRCEMSENTPFWNRLQDSAGCPDA